jgi:hypothetical protein
VWTGHFKKERTDGRKEERRKERKIRQGERMNVNQMI